jgi:hypothetical protein
MEFGMERRMRKELSDQELDQMHKDYLSGMYQRELSRKYGLSDTATSRLMARFKGVDAEFLKRTNQEAREVKKLRKKVAEQEKIIEAFRDVLHRKILRRKI